MSEAEIYLQEIIYDFYQIQRDLKEFEEKLLNLKSIVFKREISGCTDRTKSLYEFESAPDEALFKQDIIAIVRSCSEATLERDRYLDGGIPFVKIGRSVRYRKKDVLDWLKNKAK